MLFTFLHSRWFFNWLNKEREISTVSQKCAIFGLILIYSMVRLFVLLVPTLSPGIKEFCAAKLEGVLNVAFLQFWHSSDASFKFVS